MNELKKEFEEKFIEADNIRNAYAVINGTTDELWQWIEQKTKETHKCAGCEWTLANIGSGDYYETDCKNNSTEAEEDLYSYCPYCGGKIIRKLEE